MYWRNMWALIIFTLITLGAAGLMYILTKAVFPGRNIKQKFIELSYAFIPLGLSVYLAENTFRLLKGIFFIVESAGNLLGRTWEFSPDFDTINLLQLLLLGAGFISTLWAGYIISKRNSKEESEFQQNIIAIGGMAVIYFVIGINILTLSII